MSVKLGKVAKAAKKYEHVLIIMRHAKAEPFGSGFDRDRNLTDKGLKQAKIIGKGLASLGLVPDRIACSSAIRTKQTLERMLKTFGDEPIVDYRLSLYEGGVQAVLDELAHTKEKTRVLMVISHEPMVSISSQWLVAADSSPALLDLLNLGLSPAQVVIFGSDKPFDQWQVRSAELLAVIGVKDFD